MIKKYDLVIFDFDGTLADTFPWFLSMFDELAERFQLPRVEKHELEELRRLDIQQILKMYNIPIWKVIQIGNHLKKLMTAQAEKISLVHGIQPVLDQLAELGVRLSVVSSNDEENIRKVLGPQNTGLFDFYECGVSMFGKKGKFQKVMKATGVHAHRTLCIGDELRDLQSAQQARIPFGAVDWGYTALERLLPHAPDEVFTHPEQILQAVTGI
jgi:phosphoglycolate phosphatase